ncbi:hypothetical protein CO116_00930 [Candidatus Falkowbacteria bacterium CG_4_9_14_3_um_filter_38_19]|uniref:Uncharacterized protein n=2 Tax=Candidatus Falkowiibacteriota TaxID=1752728 RepID=A0A2M6WSE3_9BACT|nr:hypothetical protein [Candidatus Parcubacteria bacterium]PIT95616.1 MAG: hypothetical protein COT96_00230 [Candidatus Falkowbacteria bacterium CG10_big_fil_rev_8_21_14_0_10_38_22]PJB17407.1 MAG: hypothetical protein CO116_00930 [Candidatus Falkowbacteria bacterium CG_4_9_14_3_um_filter_38_19]
MATQTTIKERVLNIQTELEVLKKALLKEPDFDIDEKNWQKIRPELKKIRKELFKKTYAKK